MAKSRLFCTHDAFPRSGGQSAVIVKDKAEKPTLGYFKSAAAMALSIGFSKGDTPANRSKNLLWIFYTTTPIGILGGAWVGAYLQGPGEVHFEAIFDALAAGTFFYIAVMDLLAEEFQGNHNHGQKFLMAIMGFGIMAVVAIWT